MTDREVKRAFFLITENRFHTTYLIDKWMKAFGSENDFKGIMIRGNKNEASLKDKLSTLPSLTIGDLEEIYGELSNAEKEMIMTYGVPKNHLHYHNNVILAGEDLNSKETKNWLESVVRQFDKVVFFIFLDVMLEDWWIELTKGQIINAHSAVLPFARGMNAIESMAYKGDIEEFKKSVGASVHFIDNGIDTGPILIATRITNPFLYRSLGDVKGACYQLAFDLLIHQASKIHRFKEKEFVGISPDKSMIGPVFYSKHFSNEIRKIAEFNYLNMKKEVTTV
ncbi:formyltransferase family protein [Bacillus vallismortis]|uniref:formyltransferase family protein n=1 Tax=Bacillus vallismortis TaxID=72361 RepID=UPI0022813FC7|nr:formyltransferase family protein [Bacillus vallismortis]MCY7918674.1 hypothetical protein [Bacillus vallismortis]MCY8309186.1 hypothetical protein [Bacillus vallismortis]MCY8531937.1 hypothetical protein [Bacillus vallismortis]MCY8596225.1 hypothetical protein [Bacillus vallismortis]MEC1650899.1 formyltransferase family protein [Bacillus vallismortis]